jgi:hypothetical protein
MIWTHDKPTVPGWYEWKLRGPYDSVPVEIKRLNVLSCLYVFCDGRMVAPLYEFINDEWAGPLEPPKEQP